MEDLDGVEMDTQERVESGTAGRGIDSRVESGVAIGKEKQVVEDSDKIHGLGEGLVMKGSHLGLVEGSKTVHMVGNPDGQGGLNKKIEGVQREVTNLMKVGPVSFKPKVVGPDVQTANVGGGGVSINIKKAQEARAQVVITQQGEGVTGRAFGSGVSISPSSLRPPNPNRREDKSESLELPQFVKTVVEGGDARTKERGPDGRSRFDDDMLNAEAVGSTTDLTGH